MMNWTFEYLKKKRPYIYPENEKFWFPLYILQDCQPKTARHTHEFFEIAIVHYGKGEHTHFFPGDENGKKDVISAGDVFGILPGDSHAFQKIGCEWSIFNILFDTSALGEDWDRLIKMPGLNALFHERRIIHLSLNCFETIISAIQYVQQEIFHRSANYEINLKGLLLDLLLRIGRSTAQTDNLQNNVYTDLAIQYMHKNAARKITLEDIAKFSGVNKTYLCHLFQKNIGMSLWDFLNRNRIERAKFYLQTTDNSISEIASMCGFENSSYFAKIFRKFEGITPSRYLDNMK